MALIMFSGMFGFGEMVPYISFTGDGGRSRWCGRLDTAESALMKNFPFSIGSLNYACWIILLRTTIWNFTCLLFLLFFRLLCVCLVVDNIIKQSSKMGFWEDCLYLCWHVCSKEAVRKHHVPHTDLANANVNFIAPFVCEANGTPVTSPVRAWIRWMYVAWACSLCDFAVVQKLREEKSLSGVLFLITQRAPSAPYFFCSESPGYTSVISLLLPPPSQLRDTNGID